MKKIIIMAAIITAATSCSEEQNFDATGTFEATEVVVAAEGNGKILSFDIEEGDKVELDQTVGIIDTMQLYYAAEGVICNIKSIGISKPDIKTQIAVLTEQLSTAQSELIRAEKLAKANAGNQKNVDDLTNQIAYIKSQISAQHSTLAKSNSGTDAKLEAMSYELLSIYDKIQKCRIATPTSGVVLQKYAEEGEMAAVGKPLFKVADLNSIYLRAYLTAEQLYDIELNQTVKISTDSGKSYSGRVSWISDKAEFTPKGILTKDERANLVYAIKVAVENDGSLKIGQYGELQL